MTLANADDRDRTLLNVPIRKDNNALDAEPPIASLLKSRMIGGGVVNAAVRGVKDTLDGAARTQ